VRTLFITGKTVSRVLPMSDCIELMAGTFAELAAGRTGQPLRTVMRLPGGRGLLGLMPAHSAGRAVTGVKALSVFPGNARVGLGSHQGVVLLFEAEHGRLLAVVDAESITALRTPAVSAVATRLLARDGAATLALLGAGAQALGHLAAIRLVRKIERAFVWDIHPERARAFAGALSEDSGIPITAVASAQEAVAEADVICAVTPAKEPILRSAWVRPGTHVNAVGACTPDARELDSELIARARVFADSRESLLAESGDFLIPLREGVIGGDHLRGELGALVTGTVAAREGGDDVTVFKSLGLGCEDLAVADVVYRRCVERGLGIAVGEKGG
jgi:ornithine cyclodeaminase